ncbi:MAG: response regulator [Acidobacteria bacterium]|nr:MAG: response regulator [Acidobacteriota bacterium]REK06870.1 MAG: response regulator [Acidobacteriota bacterium]
MNQSSRATILVVDDEKAILTLAEMTLAEEGHEVVSTTSSSEALEIVDSHEGSIDLFLIDVVMPEMSGPELAEQLTRKRPGVPVIFFSGYGEAAGVALRKRDAGAHYLKKPFSPAKLAELAQQVLERDEH